MAFNKQLLDIVACPICKGQLTLTKVAGQEHEELVCKFDRLAYPIKDNIPVLLENEARELSLDELESVQ